MKKTVALTCIVAILFISGTSFADDAVKKLERGLSNIVTSPIEIINGIKEAKAQGEKTGSILPSGGVDSAILWGIPNGIGRMLIRALVGIYEVATFPIPIPSEYKPILRNIDDPEFFF